MPEPHISAIAAIITRSSGEANRLIADFATRQRAAGWRIRGLIQEQAGNDEGGIVLIDLDDGTRYPITQDLGTGTASCGLDPARIADASHVMHRIANEGADLAVFNRFSGLEAEGGGFAAEMLLLMSSGMPVLAIVPEHHLLQWRKFTGGHSTELPPATAALENWFLANFSLINRYGCSELPRSMRHSKKEG